MAKNNKTASWDDPANEALNSFVSWGEVNDFVLGTLIGVKEVKSTLPDKAGEMQKIYTVKVKECSYHTLDDKKRVVEPAVTPEVGSIVNVGDRSTISSRMAQVKLGQIFGLKFVEEQASKTKGYNATKLIKVFTPKNADGSFEMDEEYLAEQKKDGFGDL